MWAQLFSKLTVICYCYQNIEIYFCSLLQPQFCSPREEGVYCEYALICRQIMLCLHIIPLTLRLTATSHPSFINFYLLFQPPLSPKKILNFPPIPFYSGLESICKGNYLK